MRGGNFDLKLMLKKCLVLDLDNTLWGGVVGEDGLQGIKLDMNAPGANFIAFQQTILDLWNRGVILAINSKNNYEDAMAVIKNHPNMVLKEKHFAAMRINWQDKADNMRELAKELNVGMDSFVFLDDDPMNRSLVKAVLPEVEVPELPSNPEQYAKFLMNMPYFESAAITDEDKMRGNLYVTEKLRKEAEDRFANKGEFLKDLNIELKCYVDDPSCISRLAQLTERTSQFNTNKKSLTEKEVADFILDKNYKVFYGQAQDKFGDYGIISFALVRKDGDKNWIVESLLMSCRALGRGIEEAFMDKLREMAVGENIENIRWIFKETEKNMPARDFYQKYSDPKTGDILWQELKKNSAWVTAYFWRSGDKKSILYAKI